MFVRKKKWKELLERVERLESSDQEISTEKYGKESLKVYIRRFSESIKADPSKELRSWWN